jgi:hypothetical protein
MASYIPPPYEELAEDGERYFKILGTPPALITTYEYLLEAAELAAKMPGFQAQGIEIDLLLRQMEDEVRSAARSTAIQSVALIRSRIEATRVRPKGDGKLSASILSKPVPGPIGTAGGSVGIGAIDELNVGTLRPSSGAKVPFFWRAQEFGSDHLVGQEIIGVFQPGESAPSQASFRSHPFFETRRKGGGRRYKMVIRNPIEERGYLREGAMEAAAFRRTEFKAIEARAVDRMKAIVTGAPRI